MSGETLPGLREEFYLHGYKISAPITRYGPTFLPAEERDRTRSGRLWPDRAEPEDGWPYRLRILTLQIGWQQLTGEDIDALNEVIALGGPFDFCPWKNLTEVWWIEDGTPLSGFIPRRHAPAWVPSEFLPDSAATLYPVVAKRGEGSTFAVTLGTPDADGVTPWVATTPGTGTGEFVKIRYTPLYSGWVAEDQQEFTGVHTESQTFTIEEM